MASWENEIAGLDRVLTRLALTEEAQLEKVLSKLLPIVIDQLKSPHDQTRKKVLELLSHVNKRVKGHNEIHLPLESLLALYNAPASGPLVHNFALVYVELAFERASSEERGALVGELLRGISGRSMQHQEMLLRMAAAGLEHLSNPPPAHKLGTEQEFSARYPFLAAQADRQAFLDFALKVLLYQPAAAVRAPPLQAQGRPQRPLGPSFAWLINEPAEVAETLTGIPREELMDMSPPAASAGAGQIRQGSGGVHQNGGAAGSPSGPLPPYGLSEADVKLLLGKCEAGPDERTLTNRKLGILNFTAAAGVAPAEVVLHYLVASVDPQDAVARRGEELSKKRCATEGMRPPVDLEDTALLRRMFALFHGTPLSAQDASIEKRVRPASPAVRARLVGLFSRSIAAASMFPENLRTVFACVYHPAAQRLRQPGMEFAVWIFKHADAAPLLAAAPPMLRGLLHLLDDEELAGTDAASSALRSFTYQAIGQLAARAPALFRSDAAVAARFFRALSTERAGVRASLQEALSALATAHRGCTGGAAQQVEELLLEAVAAEEEAARLCAAQWAQRLFAFDHVPARYICVVAAGDTKLEVREAGMAGLQKPKPQAGEQGQEYAVVRYPEPSAVVEYFKGRIVRFRSAVDPTKPLAMPHRAFLALITFLRQCRTANLTAEAYHSGGWSETYLGLLEHALVRDSPSELHAAALEAVLEVAATDPTSFAGHYRHRVAWLQGFLGHVDAAVRELAARLLGIVTMAMSRDAAVSLLHGLLLSMGERDGKAARFEDAEGALSAVGYVLAQCLTGVPMVPEEELQKAAAAIYGVMRDMKGDHAATAAMALGHAGLRVPLPLPSLSTASADAEISEGAAYPGGSAPVSEHSGVSTPSSKGPDAVETELNKPSREGVLQALATMMAEKDVKVATRSATAAGFLCNGDASKEVLTGVLESLIKTSTIKSEALHFAVGEALCFLFGGVSVSADAVLYSNYHSLVEAQKASEGGAEPHSGAEAVQVNGHQEVPSVAPKRGEMQELLLERILGQLIYDSSEGVRAAACVWLVSLCRFTGRQPRMLSRLADIQEAFSSLLGDSSEIAQEMASQGLSVIYQLGDASMREKLLSSLMGTLQGAPRKRRAVKLTGDSKVFEEGQLGEAPGGGSLATYRELCALATEMGQPDLLVRFMDLANHASAMASTRSAAYGFASIAKLAGEQLQPYIAVLVPKLYRYQYDPNPRVRDAMAHIWRALVDNPKEALDAHFEAVVRELLKDIGGRLWRNREAACAALADLLQGRRWAEVSGLLEEMWVMVLRASDDIKDSVRAAASGTLRTLRSVTLRLADPAASPPADAAAAVALMLPFLLQTGVGSSVKEVQALSLMTVAKMVQTAGPEHIRPQLARLVPALLESLSGMEDARLNYVEQHAERIGLDSGRLENMRVAASKSSPMADTLDLAARYTDIASLDALVPALCQLLKRGVGVNTRVGSARFVASLAARMGSDIRPHTGTLLKALVGAARSERSTAVRRGYAQAFAAVVKYAAEARAAKVVAEAAALYSEPGDREARQLAGLLLRELVRGAVDTFSAHAAAVLPLAFVARADEDADVAALWKEVWEEGTGSGAAAVRLYIDDIVPLICDGLASQQWGRKSGAAKSVVSLVDTGGAGALSAHAEKLGGHLLQELPGRLWEGKENVLEAIGSLVAAEPAAFKSPDALIAALLGAVERRKATFQMAALAALQKVLAALPGDHLGQVTPPLLAHIEQATAPSSTPAPKDSGGDEQASTSKSAPQADVAQCLIAAWQHAGLSSMAAHGPGIARALLCALSPEQPFAQRLSLLPLVGAFTEYLGNAKEQQDLLLGNEERVPVRELLVSVLPGVLECTKDTRYSQLRIAALDALTSLVNTTRDGHVQAADMHADITAAVTSLSVSEKNAIVLGKAEALQRLLMAA